MTAQRNGLRAVQAERRVGLVVRVSTDLQAANPEGSLVTQLQRLREHVRYKRDVIGEAWEETAVYELRGVSGKNSVRSREFERLFADIRSGRVNTIACTSLERICRSVADFLKFFEVLNDNGVEFVCLKQQYDTTSPQGRLFVTMMMALAQFEREQTAERTRDSTLARAERGLWNGGRLFGYDLDPDRKGYPVPDADEAAVVAFAFQTFLETGSIAATAEALNRSGFRTKAFTSRREVAHPARAFSYTAVQRLLKNPAYVGQKVIDVRGERRVVEAVWPAVVEPATFERAQRLLELNGRTNHSQAKDVRHVHILGGGLLVCGRCSGTMQGRSGTGKQGRVYFYYACLNGDCRLRVVAHEVEHAVLSRIGALSADPETVALLTEKANKLLQKQKPAVDKRLRSLARTRRGLDGEADKLAGGLARATPEAGRLLNGRLAEAAARRMEIDAAVREAERELAEIDRALVSPESVRSGLLNFGKVFPSLRPFEQRELVRLLLRRAELGDRQLVLELYGKASACFAGKETANPALGFAEVCDWLPDEDSNLEHRG